MIRMKPKLSKTSIVGRSPSYFGLGCILETSLIQIYFSLFQQVHHICTRNLHKNNKTETRESQHRQSLHTEDAVLMQRISLWKKKKANFKTGFDRLVESKVNVPQFDLTTAVHTSPGSCCLLTCPTLH